MYPEAPTPFPLLEITRNPEHPLTLLDLEIHPPALTTLMDGISDRRNQQLSRIVIDGGLVEAYLVPGQVDLRISKRATDSPDALGTFLDKLYRGNQASVLFGGCVGGYYLKTTKEIFINPDTILVASLARTARNDEVPSDSSCTQASVKNAIQEELNLLAAEVLIDELEHSFQKVRWIDRVLPIPSFVIDQLQASSKRSDPQLQRLAMQSMTLNPLISDEKLLELYDIARDRYQALKNTV